MNIHAIDLVFYTVVDALTSEERERFDSLSEQKLKVVIERNEIVDQMEEDRMQELKELEESTDVGIEGGSSETSEGLCECNCN